MSGRYSSSSRRSDGRTSKPEVPISRHSVLFRGFKTDVDIKGVKDYFVDEVGPCTVDSVEKENGMINLALRFESRQDATSCIERFNGQFLFHSKVELSRFRDTRRFVNRYQPTSRCDGNQDSSVRPIYRSRSRERRSADRSRSPVKIVHLNSPSASRDANARCKSLAPVRGPKTPPLTPNGRSATLSDMDISDFEEEINRKIDKQTTPTIEPKIQKEPPRWKPFSNQEVEKECSVKHNTSASSCSTNTQQSGIDLNVTSNGTNGLSTHEGKSNETVLFGQYLVAVLEQLSGGQRLKLQLRFQQIIYDELYANDESSRI